MENWIKNYIDKLLCLRANENDNANDNDQANNIISTIKDTKLYVPVVTLSAKNNQKLSKLLGKRFDR